MLELPCIAHEIRHLADSLFHSKFLSREQILAKKGLDTPKFTRLYEEEVYVRELFEGKKDKKQIEKIVKHKIEKHLRTLPVQDKIDILQTMRYSLISEKNAYKDGSKCEKKLFKKNLPVYEDSLENPSKEYMFDEKIGMLKNMISELIQKERTTHKAKLKRGKKQNFLQRMFDR